MHLKHFFYLFLIFYFISSCNHLSGNQQKFKSNFKQQDNIKNLIKKSTNNPTTQKKREVASQQIISTLKQSCPSSPPDKRNLCLQLADNASIKQINVCNSLEESNQPDCFLGNYKHLPFEYIMSCGTLHRMNEWDCLQSEYINLSNLYIRTCGILNDLKNEEFCLQNNLPLEYIKACAVFEENSYKLNCIQGAYAHLPIKQIKDCAALKGNYRSKCLRTVHHLSPNK